MKFNFFKPKHSAAIVINYEGAQARALSPQAALYAAVVTASLSNTHYEKADDRLQRIIKLIEQNDAAFVAKLAAYARNQMHLRSIPLVLAVELAKRNSGNAVVSKAVKSVVKRADEITELLSYYQLANARTSTKKLNKLSKQVQKGLAASFNTFDEYQFAKYNRSGVSVSLRDALFLVHPKAVSDAQQALFDKIAKQELATPYTWETELSATGQRKYTSDAERARAVRQTWQQLIASGKLGYMALLRNLRNIMEADVDGYTDSSTYRTLLQALQSGGNGIRQTPYMDVVCAHLSDAISVENAKQLPFRFLAAYREILAMQSPYKDKVLAALEQAALLSVANLKGFDSNVRVLVACDVSGSMQKPISAKSKVLLYDVGLMLGMLVQSKCRNVVTGMFGDRWKVINMPQRNVLANVQEFYKREGEVGYSTNGHLVIEDLINRGVVMDKVMMFTDCQLWNSNASSYQINSLEQAWNRYKRIAPNASLYLFDLAGYGNTPINSVRPDVHLIAGWSDKIFDVLNAIENGSSALAEIEAMEL